jgi:cytochrome P450
MQHGSRRRVLSQAFSESSLRLFEPKVRAKLDRFVSIIRSEQYDGGWSVPVDMAAACE